jgi:hypothetical protein
MPQPEIPDGIEIQIGPDGTVRIHAACQPGESPEDCAEKVRFLVEALGLPEDGVETTLRPPDTPPG